MRYVFVTASPVLTNEVRRYYHSMKESLINHLKAKEMSRAIREAKKIEQQKKAIVEGDESDDFEIAEGDESKTNITTESVDMALTAEEVERRELLAFIEAEEK